MPTTSWGRLLLTEATLLALAGCQTPPPEVAPTPPPPPVSSQPPPVEPPPKKGDLVDPPGTKAGLSALAPLFGADSGRSRPIEQTRMHTFGKGLLAYIDLQGASSEPGCPVAGYKDTECRFYRVAAFPQPISGQAWRENARAGAGEWSRLMHAKEKWSAFSPGQDVIYAVRLSSGVTIDTIDEKGNVSALIDGSTLTNLFDVSVLELKDGLVAVGVDENRALTAIPISRSGGAAKAGAVIPFQIATARLYDSAATARYLNDQKLKVSLGAPFVSALIDRSGSPEASWVMAWIEATPPPKYTPTGVPYRPKGKGKGKAKNGCGTPSRSLTDPSVDKKTHIVRLSSAGKVLEDKVIPFALTAAMRGDMSDENPLGARVFPGGIEVQGQRFTNELGAFSGDPPAAVAQSGAMPRPPFEANQAHRVIAAGYDPPSGEGLVVSQHNGKFYLQRFDGLGVVQGEPEHLQEVFGFPDRDQPTLARVGGAWVARDNGRQLHVLTGENAGKSIDLPYHDGNEPLAFFATDDQHLTYLSGTRYQPRSFTQLSFDVGTLSPTTLQSGSSRVFLDPLGAFRAEGGALMVLGRRSNRTPVLGQIDAAGGWTESSLKVPEQVGDVQRTSAFKVWQDQVLVVEGSKGAHAFWARAGASAPLTSLPAPDKDRPAPPPTPTPERGPFYFDGKWVLPSTPGDLVPAGEALSGVFSGCPYALPTGPRRVVLICAEAVDDKSLNTRVGLRVFRL